MNPFNHKISRHIIIVWLIVAALFFIGCQSNNDLASPPDFDIPVAPEIADFFHTYGGQHVFGEPITGLLTDPETGRQVQYFSRMRLEIDADHQDNQPAIDQVRIYPLGTWAYTGLNHITPASHTETSKERYFPETGFTVRNGFLDFYEERPGELLFGPPISEALEEGGRRVQYFRNARLEWHPAMPLGHRVQLGALGRAHYEEQPGLPLSTPNPPGAAQPVPLTGIEAALVEAWVRTPILYSGEMQELFVRVQTVDSRRLPVGDVRVVMMVTYGDTNYESALGLTNSRGLFRQEVDLSSIPPGEKVHLRAMVYDNAGRLLGSGVVTFRTWW